MPRSEFLIKCARAGHLFMCNESDLRLVAVWDDEPVGFLLARGQELRMLLVARAFRHRGLGGALLNELRHRIGPVVTVPVDWALAEFFLSYGWLPEEPEELYFERDLSDLPALPLLQGYQFRSFQAGDDLAWMKLLRESFATEQVNVSHFQDDYFTKRYVKAEYFDPHHAFMAVREGKLVGTVVTDPMSAKIDWLMVHPVHRRKGLGEALLLIALYGLEAREKSTAVIGTKPVFEKALNLYRKLGFQTQDPKVIFRSPG